MHRKLNLLARCYDFRIILSVQIPARSVYAKLSALGCKVCDNGIDFILQCYAKLPIVRTRQVPFMIPQRKQLIHSVWSNQAQLARAQG